MIKQPFFTRLQQELSKPNPNINNLLYPGKTSSKQQQFNEFVLKHLRKYIANHKYYEQIRDTLSKNINKRQLSIESQNKASQEEQSVQNNQLRVYVANLLKNNKQLAQCKQIINLAQQNLQQLRYVKFEAGQAFNKKIHRLVQLMNTYQSFLTYFTLQGLNSKWWREETNKRCSVDQSANEFIQNKFMQSMDTIQVNIKDYLWGMQIIKKHLPALQQFSISVSFGLSHNLDMLCKNAIKNRKQIEAAIQIIKQMTNSVRSKQIFAEVAKQQSNAIESQLQQLKKQINVLLKSTKNDHSHGFFNNLFYKLLTPQYVSLIDQVYYQLPHTELNATINDKIHAISKRINYCNHTMETIQKYSPAVNNLVHKCLFYFNIPYREGILQPEYTFSLKDLQNIEKALQTRIKRQQSKNKQSKTKQPPDLLFTQSAAFAALISLKNQFFPSVKNDYPSDGFEDLSRQLQIDVQDSHSDKKQQQKNIQPLKSQQDQIIELAAKYQQLEKELIQAKEKNSELSKLLHHQTNQNQLKMASQKLINQRNLAHFDPKYDQQKGKKELESFPKQALLQFEQMTQQIQKLKQENLSYFNQKMRIINMVDLQKERSQHQLQLLSKEKQNQMEQLKKKFIEDKQQILKQIRAQHEEQKTKLKAEIEIIQQQYTNFKNKYYDQLEQSYNQSIQRYSNNRSKGQGQANLNRSMILEEQDSKDELEQIIKLQRQKQQKFNEQIEQKNKSLSLITKQLQRTKEEKESVQKLLELKLQLIQSLKQQLKKQRQERTLQQSKLKNTSEDLQKIQRTLRDLQDTILNQKKQREEIEEKKQLQQKNNQQNQLSSNLPTLVHYNRQLFNVDIFNNNQQDKKNLVDHLQWYARSRIKQTKLVYKFDPKNKINFHQYIDEIPGLTLIIKTKSAILAGFYPGVYRDKQILNKGGLIVSVTNNNSYCMQQRKKGDTKTIYRGMIYDTFFAIYGNAEIRIKTGFKTVFSNFGVSNSYFNSRGDKVDKLLNEGDKREVQFQLCEFYQVCFETQNPNFR